MPLPPSEIILNKRGAVYHLDLLPHEIADTVLLVGDPARADIIAKRFTTISYRIQQREFVTITGFYKERPISVLSTGIGTDNIDIVLNELDLLARMDLKTRTWKEEKRSFHFIRIGTCGILQENIPVGAFVYSQYSIGFDALMHFYKREESYDEHQLKHALGSYLEEVGLELPFYVAKSSNRLILDFPDRHVGYTATFPGFYGPQGRQLRGQVKYPDFIEKLRKFQFNGLKINNFEMESSGLFGMASLLGHDSHCVCLGLANRIRGEFLSDFGDRMDTLIDTVLEAI